MTLISLKALHLTDKQILAGLESPAQDESALVTICRFYPPDAAWTAQLQEELQTGQQAPWLQAGCASLPLPGRAGASKGTLLVVSYRTPVRPPTRLFHVEQ